MTTYRVSFVTASGRLGPTHWNLPVQARNAADAWERVMCREGLNEVTDLAPYAEGHVAPVKEV